MHVRTSRVLPKAQSPPTYPTGIKQYEGEVVQAETLDEYNITVYVDFNNATVFVDLWNETDTILDHEVLDIQQAKNKTLPWGTRLFFKARSADKSIKLEIKTLKWFTMCHMVTFGVAYNGNVAESISE